MRKVSDFLLDKLFWFLLLLELPFKKGGKDYIYSRDFLGDSDYQKKLAEIYKPVVSIIGEKLDKIYSVKETVYSTSIFAKLKYCIKNKFWGIFAFTVFDRYKMGEDYFEQPSVRVYLAIHSNNKWKTLLVVKSTVRNIEVLAVYPKLSVWLAVFIDKKMVYSKERNFISL